MIRWSIDSFCIYTPMRKVVYAFAASLDGYIARPDGAFDWIERLRRPGEDHGVSALAKRMDTVLMGRKTYDIVLRYGMKGGYPGKKNYVFSRTQPPGERDGVEYTAEDPNELIARLRQQKAKDIWLFGGGELARSVLRGRQVDEIVIGILPILLGAGIAAFPADFPETDLKLIECKQYESGLVSLTHSVRR